MFGDFERQAIFGTELGLDDLQRQRGGGAPIYAVRTNCRNTPSVAEYVHLLGGLNPRYTRILRPDDGIEPEIEFYRDDDEQVEMLVRSLARLEADGLRSGDIVVLSPRGEPGCAAGAINVSPWRDRLRPIGSRRGGHIGFGTVQGFKGLEAPAVVVTDIDTIKTAEARDRLYIAVTRSLRRLLVLAHERVRDELREALAPRPSERR